MRLHEKRAARLAMLTIVLQLAARGSVRPAGAIDCATATGDCCAEHGTPGCDDLSCCQAVCACDPFCCNTSWDEFCAGAGFMDSGCGGEVLCQCEPVPPPPLAQNLTLNDYKMLVDALLPQYGPNLLNVPPGPNWLAPLTLNTVAAAVQDATPPFDQIVQDGALIEARDVLETKFIKIDFKRARVRYADLMRLFNYATSPHVAVSESQAMAMASQVFGALGLPFSEAGAIYSDKVVAQDSGPSGENPIFERERLVTAERIVNGYPVVGSIARVAISNTGQRARLLVHWPPFQMLTGLVLRPRQAVVDDIAQRIFDAEEGAVVELHIELAYARAGSLYLPAAVASFSDPLSGVVELVPVVAVPADEDWDGVADTLDNCPEDPNPNQEDEDLDGVGDPCDNCPQTSNSAQQDTDQDGVGDACDLAAGACCRTDGTCDGMSAAACGTAGGMYLGNGSMCLTDANNDGVDDACAAPTCQTASDCCDSNADGIRDDACTWCACTGGACSLIDLAVFADLGGAFGACPPDGFSNLFDRGHALTCFAGTNPCADLNIDAGGPFGNCTPDGFCNLFDANHVLTAFAGTNPCSCPPVPGPQAAASPVAEAALIAVTSPHPVHRGEDVDVRVFIDGTLDGFQSYQLHLDTSGGGAGQLQLVKISIEPRKDAVFSASSGVFSAVNLARGEVLAGLDAGRATVRGRAYLATFTYRASSDATGTFVVDVAHDPARGDPTFLVADYIHPIAVTSTKPAVIELAAPLVGDKR